MLNLDFLSDGLYEAVIYSDKDDAHYRENPFGYKITTKHVDKNDSIKIYMAPGGGFAIRLTRVND